MNAMLKLQVIIVSTRNGRLGPAVGAWTLELARAHAGFEVELVDLAEVNLPLFDEPNHPRLGQYEHAHTKAWSAIVSRADAYVFVTPEYNYSAPPSLVNALGYLNREWAYKPVGFVSYGGVSGGTRGVLTSRQIASTLRMVPVVEAVSIPFFTKYLDTNTGAFDPGEIQARAAHAMFDELARVADALSVLRAPRA